MIKLQAQCRLAPNDVDIISAHDGSSQVDDIPTTYDQVTSPVCCKVIWGCRAKGPSIIVGSLRPYFCRDLQLPPFGGREEGCANKLPVVCLIVGLHLGYSENDLEGPMWEANLADLSGSAGTVDSVPTCIVLVEER